MQPQGFLRFNGYGIALVSVAIAFALNLALSPLLNPNFFPLFLAAVALSAWYGRRGPALTATIISTLLLGYVFIPPASSFLLSGSGWARLGTFLAVAALLSYLSESRARTTELFEVTLSSIGDAVIAVDLHGRVMFFNEVAEKLTGWPRAEAKGRELSTVLKLLDEHTREPVEPSLIRAMWDNTRTYLQRPTLLISRAGNELAIEDSSSPIRDAERRVIGGVMVFRDVSERNQREEALSLTETRFKALFDQSPLSIQVISPDGVIREVNRAWEELWGVTLDQIPEYNLFKDPQLEALGVMPLIMRVFNGETVQIPPVRYDPDQTLPNRSRHENPQRWTRSIMYPVKGSSGEIREAVLIHEDITAQVTAEEIVRHSEARYRAIVNQAAVGIVETDLEGRLMFVNQRYCELLGYSADELLMRPFRELTHPDDLAENLETFNNVIATGKDYTYEKRYLRKDGSSVWVTVSTSCVRGEDGTPLNILGVVQDISDRKAADDQIRRLNTDLQRRLKDFQILLEVIPVGIAIAHDPECRVITTNPYFASLLGVSPDENLSTTAVDTALPYTFMRDGKPYSPDELPMQMAAARGAPVRDAEIDVLRSDGSLIHLLANAAPVFDETGNVRGCFGAFVDITERKHSEDRLRFLVDASTALSSSLEYEVTLQQVAQLAVPDLADWCFVDLNVGEDTFERVAVGYAQQDWADIAQRMHRRFNHRPDLQHGVSKVIHSGQSEIVTQVDDDLLRGIARDERHLEVLQAMEMRSYMIVPLRARNRILGAVSFVSNRPGRQYTTSDLVLAEDLARRAGIAIDNARLYNEAQRALRLRDQFLSLAAHELKTPLTPILGMSQLINRQIERSDHATERERTRARTLIDQVRRLQRLVNSLLDLTRIQEGRLTIEHETVDLTALARQLIEELEPTLQHHRLVVVGADAPCLIVGDQLRLEQVLQNILQNAIKYSPEGGTVRLELTCEEDRAGIVISDEGIGIPAAELPKIFDRFFRATNVNVNQISGMGIGLYVVREIVSLHGGTVQVDSREGCGTTVTIMLPRALSKAGV